MRVIFETYNDIVLTIEVIKAEIELLQIDLDYWVGPNTSRPLISQGAARYGLDVAAERTDLLYERMGKLEERLAAYEEIEKEIRENIEKLQGLEYKIAKLRFIDGLSYQDVADKLGYSYSWIRQVVSKTNKERTIRLAQ